MLAWVAVSVLLILPSEGLSFFAEAPISSFITNLRLLGPFRGASLKSGTAFAQALLDFIVANDKV